MVFLSRFLRKSSKGAGLPPGTLIHIGERVTERIKISSLEFSEESYQEKDLPTIDECMPIKGEPTITWINVVGVHKVEIIEKMGKVFNIHPLLLEDIVNMEQRPKIEDYSDYVFIVLEMLEYDENKNSVVSEHISIVLGSYYVFH